VERKKSRGVGGLSFSFGEATVRVLCGLGPRPGGGINGPKKGRREVHEQVKRRRVSGGINGVATAYGICPQSVGGEVPFFFSREEGKWLVYEGQRSNIQRRTGGIQWAREACGGGLVKVREGTPPIGNLKRGVERPVQNREDCLKEEKQSEREGNCRFA